MHRLQRFLTVYADTVVRRPAQVLLLLLSLAGLGLYGASKLTINSNQLDLISADLPAVKDIKRLIDMVGGSGYLMLALRSEEPALMKRVADDLAHSLEADREEIRFVTYKTPVEFIQQKMVLFVETADLLVAKGRIDTYLHQQARLKNPFFLQLRDPKPPQLDLQDLQDKYSRVGKKSILDDYYISDDKQMLLLLIKPMWDTNELGRTRTYLAKLRATLAAYSAAHAPAIELVEDYDRLGNNGTIAYGFTGAYKTTVDDSYAISQSLEPVSLWAFLGIAGITLLFFRGRLVPALIVLGSMLLGTVLTMGFAYAAVGQLNMITSILGGILMGFGVDYGIHFMFRTRIELGLGKPYEVALRDALVNAGRPALVAAVVTGGSFMVLMVSQFRGFSQFGLLAGCGTLIIGLTMFSSSAAVLCLLGRWRPEGPRRWLGEIRFVAPAAGGAVPRIHRPGRWLTGIGLVVAAVCAFAIPWDPQPLAPQEVPSLLQRLRNGIGFNYNTRALMPADQVSIRLQDEIGRRFHLSADPVAVVTQTLEQTREVYDALTQHPERYPDFEQVVSMYSFVPPPQRATANAAILKAWRAELQAGGFLQASLLPPELADKLPMLEKMLAAEPYGLDAVPATYANQFTHLPSTRPENRGYLTFIYPAVDLLDGKKMLEFADQADHIVADSGAVYHAAGLTSLYATLARIVLRDGKLTVLLATLWILLMHWLDFRSIRLALASVLPLGVGLLMMLGLMSLTHHDLNFMNIIMLPILLGFGVSHGLYLLHRFLEGTSPLVALRSVGLAVAASTLTAMAGFASLFAASHLGLRSMGYVACLGLLTTLVVSFTVLAAVLQILYDQNAAK
jgi:predicted RND superfamily exporter protein